MKITGLRCVSLLLGAAALGVSMAAVNAPAAAPDAVRVNEFYNGLTYWDVLSKALAG